MIPIYRHPHEDEHIYGWVLDLARMNGMDLKQFLDIYGGGLRWEGAPDSVSGIAFLDGCPDMRGLLYKNTLLPALAPFMDEIQQASALNHLLYGGRGHVYHTVTHMKVCLECMGNDIQKGIAPYYRVWHQLSGVRTCALHGTALLTVKRHGSINDERVLRSAVYDGPREDNGVAGRIYSLYKDPPAVSVEGWRCCLPKRMRRRSRETMVLLARDEWIRSAPEKRAVAMIPCAACGGAFLGHPYMAGRYNVCPDCRRKFGQEGTVRFILSLRKDYRIEDGRVVHNVCGKSVRKDLSQAVFAWTGTECACLKKTGSLKIHKRSFDGGGFTVVGYEKNSSGHRVVRIRHEICGRDFAIRPADFKNNRFCRVCSSYAYGFREKVKKMTGDEYEVLGEPSSLGGIDSSAVFRHSVCGTRFTNKARNFLAGQRCPFCSPKLGAVTVISLLKENCDLYGYTLKPDGMDIWVTSPGGKTKKIRCAQAVQDITRLDGPDIFDRISRIEPPVNDKAKIFLYYRDNNDGGIFTTKDGPELTGTKESSYFTGLSHLCRQGKIERLKKGVYRIVKDIEDDAEGGS